MKLTEKILAVLITISLFLKLFLIPGGGVLLILAGETLIIMYFAFGFAFFNDVRLRHIFKKNAFAGTNKIRIIGGVGTGICLSNLLTGILFKLQYWPGANSMLLIALMPSFILMIIVLVKLLTKADRYYQKVQWRMVIIGTFSLILFFLPTIELVKLQYRNSPSYIKAFEENNLYPTNVSERKLDLEYHRACMNEEDFKQYEEYLKQQNEYIKHNPTAGSDALK